MSSWVVSDLKWTPMVRFSIKQGAEMDEACDKEIVVQKVVYSFATTSMAKAFEACLSTGTIDTCKASWQPRAVYPPSHLDATILN